MSSTHAVHADWPAVTVAVINHNGQDVLPRTLDALRASDYPDLRVMVVDDMSTDASVALVRERYPQVRLVPVPAGLHKGKPSVPRNLALREADTPLLMWLDNDVALEPDAVRQMVKVMRERPGTFRVMPRLVYHDQPQRIYADGSGLNYLGISSRSARDRTVHELPPGDPVASLGSGIVMVRRDVALALGGFDEGYAFGWGEDGEITVRARLLGFEAWTVSRAVGLHVEKEHGKLRACAQFYNRYRLMLINYSGRGLVLLAPAHLVFEVMTLTMGLLTGLMPHYGKAVWRVLRDMPDILAHRRFVQRHRAIGDASLLEATPILVTGVLKKSPLVRRVASATSAAFIAYWRLVSPLLHDGPYRRRPRGLAALGLADAGDRAGTPPPSRTVSRRAPRRSLRRISA